MASSTSSTAIFLLFVVSATLMLPSNAQTGINNLQVLGRLFCSVDGNACPTCSGLGGVNVIIKCNNGTVSVGSLLTDANGFINGVLNLADGLVLDNSPCFATVQLPIASCTLLPPTGILRATVNFAGNVLAGAVGLLFQALVGVFTVVHSII